jgi:hypothetical protein
MAMGTGLGNLIPVAMVLVGIVTMFRTRARRKSGKVAPDVNFDKRQAAAMEMERRMASYLAGRDTGGGSYAAPDQDEQEIRR